MKSYSELLKTYIENSGLTLSQLEIRLREAGLATNKTYISKLQNGKLPPAGDEINRALAEVLESDAEELILAAYAEKAPVLNEILDSFTDTFKVLMINNKNFFLRFVQDGDEQAEHFKTNFETIVEYVMSSMGVKDKIDILRELTQIMKTTNYLETSKFDEGYLKIDPSSLFTQEMISIFENMENFPEEKSITELSDDEHIFLTEQLKLYRDLKSKKVIN
ncbi:MULTISPECIES: helix-turn-helix transcriptional regulator [unclassified Paenibacillus]|uniref:helix-turn-helix domain-containing protein n=1 Tax=unclassified Paenibacillus TaxID=185978 RepID=UPI0008841BE0|nr:MULTISPECIES: helix-turn-helix transcriptional regulator [unclassified Paenibacillus]SDC48100.1 hypothetical protein SAMN04488602_102316 [Paenibacillus sp. cl123]